MTVLPPHNSAYRHAQEARQCFLAKLALSTNSAQVKDLCFLSHHGEKTASRHDICQDGRSS
jgi:hypothetical protein